MKISVILPVYNCASRLPAALDSILCQSADLEVIAVDDASTDASLEILRAYASKDPRVRVTSRETNGGVSAARNLALGQITGDAVAFCDADDTLPPDAYPTLLRTLGNRDAAVGGFCEIAADGSASRVLPPKKSKKDLLYALFFNGALWNKLFRRALLDGLSFDETLSAGEDFSFLADVAAKAPALAVTKRPVYFYRRYDTAERGTLTGNRTLKFFLDELRAGEHFRTVLAARPGAHAYLFDCFGAYLRSVFFSMPDPAEREEAFERLRGFLASLSPGNEEERTEALFEIPRAAYLSADADSYLRLLSALPPEDRVSARCRQGRMSGRRLIRWFFGWLGSKFSKR